MDSFTFDFDFDFDKPKKEPESLVLRVSSIKTRFTTNAHPHDEIRRNVIFWWEQEVVQRNGSVLSSKKKYSVIGHIHRTRDEHDACAQCKSLRTPYGGRNVVYNMLTLTREVWPIKRELSKMVPPKHRKCGTASYHRRIQKKWNARAATISIEQNAREELQMQLTELQLRIVIDQFYRR